MKVFGTIGILILFLNMGCSSSKKVMKSSPSMAMQQDTSVQVKEKAEKSITKKSKEKTYTDIIGKEAITDEGLFKVHHVKDKWYYEIPDELLDKDILLISRIAKTPANLSPFLNAGSKTNEQVIHWSKKGDKIILKTLSFSSVASDSLPIYKSVSYNNLEPIIASFKVELPATDTTGNLIEVSNLFLSDIGAISGLPGYLRRSYKVSRMDKSRSFIDTIRSYPINVEVVHTLTYNAAEPPSNSRTGTITLQMNQSMILLPEDKMIPRMYDERVGWFTISQFDYGSDALKSDQKTYIRKWRLEPKDPEAYLRGELVEPVKPIIYYLDPATPLKWRKYFRQGIEDWNTAFESAGFKNAIIAKDPPTPEMNPDFSPEDARFSTVRYVASTTRNAVGPSVSDPRTGEILESDIIWYHNHLRSYRNRYLIETGAANPKARTLDTPEEEIGEMMRRVISHEIGHALGLPHNMKASSAYPTDSLRSGAFTQKYGIATTIMDYARFNYVAQPGDENIRFVRQLGPYDHYAIEYGYRWYPNVDKAEDEFQVLQEMVSDKSLEPMFMFGGGRGSDPDSQTECIGDDAIKASTYGINNLKIVADNLVDWTTEEGKDYDDLEEVYGELVGIYRRYVGHVLNNVGGVHQTLKTSDQNGAVYEPVSSDIQQSAIKWLNEYAFAEPNWLMKKEILTKITGEGVIERMRSVQAGFINALLNSNRLQRLAEASQLEGENFYSLDQLFYDLRAGIFSEAYQRKSISMPRRALQRAFLDRMDKMLNPEEQNGRPRFGPPPVVVANTDIQAVAKADLKVLQADLKKAVRRQKDKMSAYHLQDLVDRIDNILSPVD
jgi:hypothetical protein